MAYLLSMKEKLEASVRKYESQSLEGISILKTLIKYSKPKIRLSQQREIFENYKAR